MANKGFVVRGAQAWLFVSVALLGSLACNPGQCLRQSDCPLGSTCKKGVCKVPKAAPSQKDAGRTPARPTSPVDTSAALVSSTDVTSDDSPDVSTAPRDSSARADSTTSDDSTSTQADAAAPSTDSGQSSILDATSDTSTTLAQ